MTYETKKNAKNATFFYKERKRTPHSFIKDAKEHKKRKRMQRMPRSFIKNAKEHKECSILL